MREKEPRRPVAVEPAATPSPTNGAATAPAIADGITTPPICGRFSANFSVIKPPTSPIDSTSSKLPYCVGYCSSAAALRCSASANCSLAYSSCPIIEAR